MVPATLIELGFEPDPVLNPELVPKRLVRFSASVLAASLVESSIIPVALELFARFGGDLVSFFGLDDFTCFGVKKCVVAVFGDPFDFANPIKRRV